MQQCVKLTLVQYSFRFDCFRSLREKRTIKCCDQTPDKKINQMHHCAHCIGCRSYIKHISMRKGGNFFRRPTLGKRLTVGDFINHFSLPKSKGNIKVLESFYIQDVYSLISSKTEKYLRR